MITCDLKGGLGNQIFQMVATLAYCVKHEIPFIFPYSDMLNERPTYWNTFFDTLSQYTTSKENFPDTELSEVNAVLYALPKHQETSFTYSEIPRRDDIMMSGYFQSYKYSENIRRKYNDIFDIKFKQLSVKTELLHLFGSPNMISIHFRMGDYKHKQEFHPVLPLDYYVNVLRNIDEPSKALVFCEKEDNEVVEGHIKVLRERFAHITFVKVSYDVPDWKQLILMSCCNMNVIANSTFSWWGAHFNTNMNRTIFYPNMWFGPSINNSVEDLFPVGWTQIPCHKIDY